MAEQWPLTLPQCFNVDGLEGGLGDNLLRSQNEQGPDKTRPRGSSKPDPFGGPMKMTWAQWLILRDFVKVTLAGGSLVMDFPWRGGTIEAKFTAMPTWRRVSPGVYSVNLPLEEMP